MRDKVASAAVEQGDVEMLRLHIAAWEHRLLATEENLHHALICCAVDCRRCAFLFADLTRRGGNL